MCIRDRYEAVQADGLNGGSCLEDTWRKLYYACFQGVTARAMQKSFKVELIELEKSSLIEISGNVITPSPKLFEGKITSEMFSKCHAN
jgi:hypothetical protein